MWFIFVFCLFSSLNGAHASGHYRVVGSRVLRPRSEYHVGVSSIGVSVATGVTVAVTERSGRVLVEQTLVVEPYTTRVARLAVPDLGKGDGGPYRLAARGNGGLSFDTSSPLEYSARSYAVIVQTDRNVYRPGMALLFRALVLNVNLKPAADLRTEHIHVRVYDGRDNAVKEWKDVEAIRGVFSGQVALSESPVLGDWTVSVDVHGQLYNKTVRVVEYVVPKFHVDIQTKKHVTFTEGVVTATVHAHYYYGEKMKGIATVTMYPTIVSGVIQPIFQTPVRKVVAIDGTVTVDFNIAKDIRLSDEYERSVLVDVVVEEALTERRQNSSSQVQLHKYRSRVDLLKSGDYYKPGLKYVASIKVSNHDGSPITEKRLTVRHSYSDTYREQSHELNKDGVVNLTFYPPLQVTNQSALRIEAEYMDLKERFAPIPAAVSSGGQYVQAELLSNRPTVNEELQVLVNCTEPLRWLTYEVFGRGDLLVAGTLQLRNEHTHVFRLTATQAMSPVAHLVISYVRADGELVSDSVRLRVHGLLGNYADVQIGVGETRPGADVEITVRAQPNSYVGLLAVDEAAESELGAGHDVTIDLVERVLGGLDAAVPAPHSSPWRPGSGNAHDALHESGGLLLTNSIVIERTPILDDVYARPELAGSGGSTVKPDRGPALSVPAATRPPLAGPYAFSRIPKAAWDKPSIHLSQRLQDTWLFNNFSAGFEGKTTIRRRVPDSVTTWLVTGFTLDPLHGLGLVSTARKLRAQSPVTLGLQAPQEARRGEVLSVRLFVDNHQPYDISAEVSLHNTEQSFHFVPLSLDTSNQTAKVELFKRKTVKVKGNSGAPVSFLVRPVTLGRTQIKATLASDGYVTSIEKILTVQAEGETQYHTKSVLIDLRKTSTFSGNVTIEVPANVAAGSVTVGMLASGDLLAPAIGHLGDSGGLLRLPAGTGDHHLMHMLANVIALDHLVRTNNLGPTMRQECLARIEIAYQQQLSFRRADGSFSPFARADSTGSIWMTALTAQALSEARRYIYIDDNVRTGALDWLVKTQGANDGFLEIGSVVHRAGQRDTLALTALVAMSFWHNQVLSAKYSALAQRSLDFLARNLADSQDIYTIAVSCYAFHLARHPAQQTAFNLLESRARLVNGTKFWGEAVAENEAKLNPWHRLPKSLDIETTAYGLLTYMERGLVEDGVPVLAWLVGQQSTRGGFTTTRDTAVALTAIARLAEKFTQPTDMQIRYTYKKQESKNVNINRGNAWLVQLHKASEDVRLVNVTAEGSGVAVFRVAYSYSVNVTGAWPMFTLDPRVDRNSNAHHLRLSVCTAYVGRNASGRDSASNMAVMEVRLPSGFTADVDSLPSLGAGSQGVRLVETRHQDTSVLLYFENVTSEERCPTVSAYRTRAVAAQLPVAVTLYDYYDSSRRARVFYGGGGAVRGTLCDVCGTEEMEQCERLCAQVPRTRPQLGGEDSSSDKGTAISLAAHLSTYSLLIAVLTVNYL